MVAAPVVAPAQQASPPAPSVNMLNYNTYDTALASARPTLVDTPTMTRQKLARAIALRDEATQLRLADGGTLSAANRRYIQRKANAIGAGHYSVQNDIAP
jgi:hypothetical protein